MRNGSGIYLIDPIAILAQDANAFEGFSNVLQSDEWILHAATQDLPCLKEIGLKPSKIFDTELAGRILGMPRVGLGALCENWLGFSLAKEHSAVDWSTRPLRDEWLTYAALDVDVLLELRNKAEELLVAQNKNVWASEEFENLLTFQPKPSNPEKWRSMSGLHDLKDQRSLAIAREIWQARESLAQKMDISPGRLIPDSSIVVAAKVKPKSRSALAGEKTFIGRGSRTFLDTWWMAYCEGNETLQLPELRPKVEGIPNHRNWESKHPEAHERLKKLRPIVADLAENLKLPVENLLQPDLLRQLCWQPPENPNEQEIHEFLKNLGARAWQTNIVAASLSEALRNQTD
jgi:ribonuclease D